MLANYGYKNGSGEFFITVDTDKCDGCGKCVPACPQNVLEMVEDQNDPFREAPVATVTEIHRKKIKYTCAPCKPASGYKMENLPCVKACPKNALSHSW